MYGTIARMRLKSGMESQMQALMEEYKKLNIRGYVRSTVYRMDEDLGEYYLAVVFENRDAYQANAQSPEQDARYQRMAELLDGDPEWHDGEIVSIG
ncbi:MAG: antibiotic biosynthesis monooxygenase [Chloroflexi bacterium]|nr:antibiotic biosynthesis monooxygenase [Chloroflexota bacterium]MDA1239392.1 antibiotic biosynthesis monooxygenase [Chloroflexota bacterium]